MQPPSPPEKSPAAALLPALLPALGGAGMLLFMMANRNPVFLMAGLVMVMTMMAGAVAMAVMSRTGPRKAFLKARERYMEYLETVRDRARGVGDAQRAYSRAAHPAPELLSGIAASSRAYERRSTDVDFGVVRVGLGTVFHPLHLQVPGTASPLDRTDPVCLRAMMSVASSYRFLTEEPLTVPLGTASSVVVRANSHSEALDVVRALLVQAACWHSPSDLRLAVASPAVAADLPFVRRLPHARDTTALDGAVPRVFVAESWSALVEELEPHLRAGAEEVARSRRHGVEARIGRTVVVVDEWASGPLGELRLPGVSEPLGNLGVCIVRIVRSRETEPASVDVRVTLEDGLCVEDVATESALWGYPDACPVGVAESVARLLAPRVVARETRQDRPLVEDTPLEALLGLEDVSQWRPEHGWAPRTHRDFLRVPIGTRADGQPLVVDLKESAFEGMGPHGLLVGATGAGKSELLRTLVLGLAATHSPDDLAFVLVDFKGGATFAGVEHLPHVAGVITNLADDLGIVDRMHEAMLGEIQRRQQILHEYGNLPNLFAYDSARRRDPSIPPLPHLLFIVDEFAELLTAKPDFSSMFTSIGRIGRSIGVHQLLASQRLDDGRLRGLESFLSYRLALRTFNADESRAVIGSPDAFELPSLPGSGYLKVDTTVFERFKAAYVSGPYRARVATPVHAARAIQILTPTNNRPRHEIVSAAPKTDFEDTAAEATVLDTLVARMQGRHGVVHQIWLPPLTTDLTLADIDVAYGRAAGGPGSLTARVGVVDRPTEQTQHPLDLDLTGAYGHLAVLGGPQSGRSTTLRTIVAALARDHVPGRIAVHAVDIAGGSMRPLEVLPHVGTVAGRMDLPKIRRILSELLTELDRRERVFAELGIDSADELRRRWDAEGGVPGLDVCDIVLAFDGYATLKSDHDDLHDMFTALVTRGLTYGVHVLTTAPRWFDLRPTLQTSIPGRLELRLNDPLDSIIERRRSATIPADAPGRALVEGGHLAQIALPVVTASPQAETDLAEAEFDRRAAERDSLAAIAAATAAPRVTGVRMLPTDLVLDEVLTAFPGVTAGITDPAHPVHPLVLGLTEENLGPVVVDPAAEDTHLIVIGDHASGRTSLLRSLCRQIVEKNSEDDVVIVLVDPRRTMLGAVPDAYLGAYAPTGSAAGAYATRIAEELAKRQPPDLDPAALTAHDWRGPRIFFVVDDAEHVLGTDAAALNPLVPYLAAGRDIGFHLILAHHSGGVAHALYQPVMRRMKELGSPAVLLSGEPDEGALWPKTSLMPLPPGRARLVRRGHPTRLIHLARP